MNKLKIKAVERLITAMSFKRSYARDKIQELGVQTYQHVFKILLFPDSQYTVGWEREIKAWFVQSVKYTNIKGGSFSTKDLRSLLLEGLYYPRPDIQQDMDFAIQQNDELKPRLRSVAEATMKVEAFYAALADALYAKDSAQSLDAAFSHLRK